MKMFSFFLNDTELSNVVIKRENKRRYKYKS